jgi:hypothetical protein
MQRFSNMRCIVSSNVVYAKIWADPFGSAHIFMLRRDSKGRYENMPVACFQAVGESLSTLTYPGGMWMGGENGRRIFRSWGGFWHKAGSNSLVL